MTEIDPGALERQEEERNAFPAAGPVKVTRQDGSFELLAPREGGDEPDKGQVRGVERPDPEHTM